VNTVSLNVNKTTVMRCTNKRQTRTHIYYISNGTNNEQVTHTTFLGVIINSSVKIKMVEYKIRNFVYNSMHVVDYQVL